MDVIFIRNTQYAILSKAFEGVDQGILKSFCGVEIDIQDSKISLTMNYYWKRIMQRFGIHDHEKEQRPLKTKVSKDDCPSTPNEARKLTYLQMIGSIIFGFTHCRLDLAFPVGMLTRVMHSPNEAHLEQLIDLLKYINATKDWGLNFSAMIQSTMEWYLSFSDSATLLTLTIQQPAEALVDIFSF